MPSTSSNTRSSLAVRPVFAGMNSDTGVSSPPWLTSSSPPSLFRELAWWYHHLHEILAMDMDDPLSRRNAVKILRKRNFRRALFIRQIQVGCKLQLDRFDGGPSTTISWRVSQDYCFKNTKNDYKANLKSHPLYYRTGLHTNFHDEKKLKQQEGKDMGI